jgi:hypothetical protein
MNIKIIKLISGENVVANVGDVTVDGWELINPMLFMPTEQGVAMAPLVLFAKTKSVRIQPSHIMFMEPAEDEIANPYNEKFGTGIVLPPSTIQLG